MSSIVVPYLDLATQYRALKAEVDTAVLRVLDSTQYILGPEVGAFEKEFAAWCGVPECVAVNSGTSALPLALLAYGIGPGDEVMYADLDYNAMQFAMNSLVARRGATVAMLDIPEPATRDNVLAAYAAGTP